MHSSVDLPSDPDLPAYQRSPCAESLPSPPAGYSSLMIGEDKGTMEESLHITLLSSPLTRPLALQHIGSWSSISGHRSGSLEADHVTSTGFKTCRGQGAYHRGYSAGFTGSGGGAVGLAVSGQALEGYSHRRWTGGGDVALLTAHNATRSAEALGESK